MYIYKNQHTHTYSPTYLHELVDGHLELRHGPAVSRPPDVLQPAVRCQFVGLLYVCIYVWVGITCRALPTEPDINTHTSTISIAYRAPMWSRLSSSLACSTMGPPRPTVRGSARKEGGRICCVDWLLCFGVLVD